MDDDDVNGTSSFFSTTTGGGGGESMQPQPNPIGSPSVHTMIATAVNDSSSSSSFNGTDFSSTSVPIYNGVAGMCLYFLMKMIHSPL